MNLEHRHGGSSVPAGAGSAKSAASGIWRWTGNVTPASSTAKATTAETGSTPSTTPCPPPPAAASSARRTSPPNASSTPTEPALAQGHGGTRTLSNHCSRGGSFLVEAEAWLFMLGQLSGGPARATEIPPSSATAARATTRTWRSITAASPNATGKPSSMPQPSGTMTTPPPTQSTASRRDRRGPPRVYQPCDHQENHVDGEPGDMCNNRRAAPVDHRHRKGDNGGNRTHSRNGPMPTAVADSACSSVDHHPPMAATGGPAPPPPRSTLKTETPSPARRRSGAPAPVGGWSSTANPACSISGPACWRTASRSGPWNSTTENYTAKSTATRRKPPSRSGTWCWSIQRQRA